MCMAILMEGQKCRFSANKAMIVSCILPLLISSVGPTVNMCRVVCIEMRTHNALIGLARIKNH